MLATVLPARADAGEATVKKNSPFKDFSLSQVADGQILESREGASLSPQIEAVQTCFIIKASPETVTARILNWNPAGKPGLEVSKHLKLPGSVSADNFQGPLASIFKSSGDASWIAQQSKNAKDSSCELLLTAQEKDRLAAAPGTAKLTSAWAQILAARFNSFQAHGAPDFQSLRSVMGKLGVGGISGPSGGSSYWEAGDVSNRGTFSEGVSWTDGNHVCDGEFFVTSEYSASLNVSTLWPVTVDKKPATLVWRIDAAYADQFADQSGAERIASAGLILSSAKKTIEALQAGEK